MGAETQLKTDLRMRPAILSWFNLNPEKPKRNELQTDRVVHEWTADWLYDPGSTGYKEMVRELDDFLRAFKDKYRGVEPKHFPTFEVMGEWQNEAKGKKNKPHIIGLHRLRTAQQKEGKDFDFSPPQLMGPDGTPINHSNFYSGCWVRGVITLREYAYKKGDTVLSRGVTSDLRAVQFIKDGEPLGGGAKDYTSYLVDSYDEDASETVAPENRAVATPRYAL
jgi:hypothetical protein